MTHSSQQKIESALAAMEAVLERAQGGRTDDEALLDFRCRCWELMLVVDDGSCQAHIDALVQHAKALYSDRERDRAAALRTKLRALLAEFRLATSTALS
jgi:hypothetical protein